ncbi:hypothetical protein [Burkholderia thailandensis]|uniref:hypothetical protein n=1 Tax=Burkholderia thailandensis TaxID=57975 RepID=UPI0020A4017E|nr:hypothetical protein [Burkholderia thailandensis]MCS6517708.1 hypothetical protein [Burkholderia thailandensis]WRS65095.1 hypothetical protein U9S59_13765 [Burkholderia thailandensis]
MRSIVISSVDGRAPARGRRARAAVMLIATDISCLVRRSGATTEAMRPRPRGRDIGRDIGRDDGRDIGRSRRVVAPIDRVDVGGSVLASIAARERLPTPSAGASRRAAT